ncbi:MAG: metalloregulator ArsR/SmtB family transcription factor [Candidatus Thermoplasmatota archaeon]|jgi:ArsR family transcriptional regulator|nr:ArsR family transcriptional regulator [Candidatus Sysuiplasma jiujiangense]MBX8641805.1 ArsR family transcriptional regulator [Candidatus Sysuiplasma jiujiangense]MCL4317567.1 metalloregulator ArsR/SmtB family transcription factor [Candidatus Thermoplasmatota archaeon]
METCIPRKITIDPNQESLSGLVSVFSALAEPARLLIVRILALYGETCTCEIASALKLSQPTVTHHLKTLEEAGIIYRRPQGKWTYFGLTGERISDVILLTDSIYRNRKQHVNGKIDNRLSEPTVTVRTTAAG